MLSFHGKLQLLLTSQQGVSNHQIYCFKVAFNAKKYLPLINCRDDGVSVRATRGSLYGTVFHHCKWQMGPECAIEPGKRGMA